MEIVNVTENATFARVKLGAIRPNRFRNLDRYPLESEVIAALKQSIDETGFWNNLQAIRNEQGEIELRFGHHRLAAGMELFGPDYEVAVEIVPFDGEDGLQTALTYENSIHRNQVAHCQEMVEARRTWWDDKVFESYPTWEDAVEDRCHFFAQWSGKIPRPLNKPVTSTLEKYFGPVVHGGPGAYAKSVETGIGRRVLRKMFPDEITEDAIREAMAAQGPITRRAKRFHEAELARQRQLQEAARAEAERQAQAAAEARAEAEQERRRIKDEQYCLAVERQEAEADARAAKDRAARQAADEKRRAIEERQRQASEEHQRMVAEQEEKAKRADENQKAAKNKAADAAKKTRNLENQEWYDERASRVFEITSHGAAFRRSVSQEGVKPYLETENLLPFAMAIRAELERRGMLTHKDKDALVTSDNITALVNENFREFKKTLKLKEREEIQSQEQDNPEAKILRAAKEAGQALSQAADKLYTLNGILKEYRIAGAKGVGVEVFLQGRAKLERAFKEFESLSPVNPK
jgi:hypothetical protein